MMCHHGRFGSVAVRRGQRAYVGGATSVYAYKHERRGNPQAIRAYGVPVEVRRRYPSGYYADGSIYPRHQPLTPGVRLWCPECFAEREARLEHAERRRRIEAGEVPAVEPPAPWKVPEKVSARAKRAKKRARARQGKDRR